MIEKHFDTSFDTERLGAIVNGKQEYGTILVAQKGMLQPAGDEFDEVDNVVNILFTGRIDIRKGDLVNIGTTEYKVIRKLDYNFGVNRHYKLLLSSGTLIT